MQGVVAFVLAKNGTPLMPMHSYGKVRKLLKAKRTVIKSRVPFVIQLTYEISDPVIQEITLGIDPGRTNIGLCAVDNKGNVLYAAGVTTRNKEIPDLMQERSEHRSVSRTGERNRRQRRAIKHGTCFQGPPIKYRMLPKYKEPIKLKYIKNTEAKFLNRKREEGWLTPTANQLLETHLHSIDLVKKILPISNIVLEMNKFDFVKMENPGVKNWEYQKGKLWRYGSVEEAVFERQEGHCLFCKKPIEHYHHNIPKHLGGSESLNNRCGLCEKHHHLVHTEQEWTDKLKSKQAGLLKKYHALSVINQIMPKLIKTLADKEKNFFVTTGHDTKQTRDSFGLDKVHYIDAWCIATSILDCKVMPKFEAYTIKQFRRQNRAIIHHQTERTYKLNGEIIAKNRNKRIEQKENSLHEWREKTLAELGPVETQNLLKQLVVIKSTRHYNTEGRLMPGAVFEYNGERLVLSGQHSYGQYYRTIGDSKTNYPAKKCRILTQNTGLVYL